MPLSEDRRQAILDLAARQTGSPNSGLPVRDRIIGMARRQAVQAGDMETAARLAPRIDPVAARTGDAARGNVELFARSFVQPGANAIRGAAGSLLPGSANDPKSFEGFVGEIADQPTASFASDLANAGSALYGAVAGPLKIAKALRSARLGTQLAVNTVAQTGLDVVRRPEEQGIRDAALQSLKYNAVGTGAGLAGRAGGSALARVAGRGERALPAAAEAVASGGAFGGLTYAETGDPRQALIQGIAGAGMGLLTNPPRVGRGSPSADAPRFSPDVPLAERGVTSRTEEKLAPPPAQPSYESYRRAASSRSSRRGNVQVGIVRDFLRGTPGEEIAAGEIGDVQVFVTPSDLGPRGARVVINPNGEAGVRVEIGRAEVLDPQRLRWAIGHETAHLRRILDKKRGVARDPSVPYERQVFEQSADRLAQHISGLTREEFLGAHRPAAPLDEPTMAQAEQTRQGFIPRLRGGNEPDTALQRSLNRLVQRLPEEFRIGAKKIFGRAPQETALPFTEAQRALISDVRQAKRERPVMRSAHEIQEDVVTRRSWEELGYDHNALLKAVMNPRVAELRAQANQAVERFGDLSLLAADEGRGAAQDMVAAGVIPRESAEAIGDYQAQVYRRVAEVEGVRDVTAEDLARVSDQELASIGLSRKELLDQINSGETAAGARLRAAERITPGKQIVGGGKGRKLWQSFVLPKGVTDHTRRRSIVTSLETFNAFRKSGDQRLVVPKELFYGGHFVLEKKVGDKVMYLTPELDASRILAETLWAQRSLRREGNMIKGLIDLGSRTSIDPAVWDKLTPDAQQSFLDEGWRPIDIVARGQGEFASKLNRGLLGLSSTANGLRRFRPDVAEALETIANRPDAMMSNLRAGISGWKELKTVQNPGSHFNQTAGNMILGMFEMMMPWQYAPAVQMMIRVGKGVPLKGEDAEAFRLFDEAGNRVGSFARSAELRTIFNDASDTWDWKTFGRWIRKERQGARDLWAFEDNVPKLALYLREFRALRKKGWTVEQAAGEANGIVDRAFPNFARLSKFQKLVGEAIPFSTFETEFARIASGHIWRSLLSTERMLTGKAFGRPGAFDHWWRHGGRNAAGMGIVMGGMHLINESFKEELEISEEEERLIKKQFGGFPLNIIIPNPHGEGAAVLPLTNVFPFFSYFDWRESVGSAEGFARTLGSRAISNPVVRVPAEIAAGREFFTDRKIRGAGEDVGGNYADYAARTILPSYLGYGLRPVNFLRGRGQQGRLVQALEGTNDYLGQPMTPGRAAASSLTGFRAQPLPNTRRLQVQERRAVQGQIGEIDRAITSQRRQLAEGRTTRERAQREIAALMAARRAAIIEAAQ